MNDVRPELAHEPAQPKIAGNVIAARRHRRAAAMRLSGMPPQACPADSHDVPTVTHGDGHVLDVWRVEWADESSRRPLVAKRSARRRRQTPRRWLRRTGSVPRAPATRSCRPAQFRDLEGERERGAAAPGLAEQPPQLWLVERRQSAFRRPAGAPGRRSPRMSNESIQPPARRAASRAPRRAGRRRRGSRRGT